MRNAKKKIENAKKSKKKSQKCTFFGNLNAQKFKKKLRHAFFSPPVLLSCVVVWSVGLGGLGGLGCLHICIVVLVLCCVCAMKESEGTCPANK